MVQKCQTFTNSFYRKEFLQVPGKEAIGLIIVPHAITKATIVGKIKDKL